MHIITFKKFFLAMLFMFIWVKAHTLFTDYVNFDTFLFHYMCKAIFVAFEKY